jgi:predicted ABC-type ATPase
MAARSSNTADRASPAPVVIVIGGPNGAGKSTIAREVLATTLGITEFVNADTIAAGLSGFEPERAAFAAGRVMLARLHELADARANFAFESTLASRSFAPWLRTLRQRSYEVHIIYIWVRSPEISIRRVKARVRRGGHSVPEEVIQRRHPRSAANFWHLYRPLADTWQAYDNSGRTAILMAAGQLGRPFKAVDQRRLAHLLEHTDGDDEEDPGPDHA